MTQDASGAVRVRRAGIHARYLAAADGLHSPIRDRRSAWRGHRVARVGGDPPAHSMIAPWSDCVEVYWSDDAEAYVTPVADDCVGIAILTSRKGGFDAHLDAFPALQERVRRSAHGPDRAAGPLRQKVRSRVGGQGAARR